MISAILLSCSLIAADASPVIVSSAAADREAYEAARAKVGRDPDANVRLALWCEARGLKAERLKHLSLAILADPKHATARSLMGLVSEAGRWSHPDTVAARIKADAKGSAIRAEYEARRAKTGPTADDQWKLARWCEEVGLTAEATAHDTAVTRLDPSRDAAWKKLGCKKFEGRWLTPEQILEVKLGREAQAQAEKRWRPILERYKGWMDHPLRLDDLEQALLKVSDPLAVRSIWRVFATGNAAEQVCAVQLFGQLDSIDASRALTILGVYGKTDEVRRRAIETLRERDIRGVLDPVIQLLRDPIKFVAKPNQGPDSPGMIFIEGKDANLERIYPIASMNFTARMTEARKAQLLEQLTSDANLRFADDVRSLNATNMTIEATNKNALALLKGVTGKDFGLNQVAWMAWWTDKKGYAFQAPPDFGQTVNKPTFTEFMQAYERPHNACFAAGTPVQTVDGPRAIEDLKIGDRLLTQDTTTGVLTYQPTLAIFHNPPAETLSLRIGGETVVATGIHRFWKAGQGWVMARELKVGDTIRRVGDTAQVEAIEPDKKQPVFNLEVARGTDFFVGKSGVLVHDNNLVETVTKPFDAVPDVSGIAKAR